MIEINQLCKTFINKKKGATVKKEAVRNVSFQCQPGRIFGLLGPNGAGKTTTLRCISTLIKPTSGTVQVSDFDVCTQSKKVRSLIGFLTSDMKLDGFFSPDYLLEYFGRLNKLSKDFIHQRKETLVAELGMEHFRSTKVDKLSTGMKQKTSIALSLIHDPQVIIFDEPTNGLDIITARTVTQFLQQYARQGKTVLISTHVMSVAEKICDDIGIIVNGELKECGTMKDILNKTNANDLEDVLFTYLANEEAEHV